MSTGSRMDGSSEADGSSKSCSTPRLPNTRIDAPDDISRHPDQKPNLTENIAMDSNEDSNEQLDLVEYIEAAAPVVAAEDELPEPPEAKFASPAPAAASDDHLDLLTLIERSEGLEPGVLSKKVAA